MSSHPILCISCGHRQIDFVHGVETYIKTHKEYDYKHENINFLLKYLFPNQRINWCCIQYLLTFFDTNRLQSYSDPSTKIHQCIPNEI